MYFSLFKYAISTYKVRLRQAHSRFFPCVEAMQQTAIQATQSVENVRTQDLPSPGILSTHSPTEQEKTVDTNKRSIPFSPLLVSDQEARKWSRRLGAISDQVDLFRVKVTIEHHQDCLQSLAFQIESILDPVLGDGRFPGFCGLPFRRKTKLKNGVRQLKILQQQQESIQQSIRILRSLYAPARRLPPELISEIFKLCLPCDKFIRPEVHRAPLLLTQICSSWRNVCISNPVFWTSLEISNRNVGGEISRKHNVSGLLDMWFSRAGNSLLSFSVQDRDDNLLLNTVKSKLDELACRWRHLRFHIPESTCLCLSSHNNYPVLETFEICTPEGLEELSIEELSCAMMKAPNLRRFIWDNAERHPTPLELHWANLTHLTLNTTIDMDQCLTIMSTLHAVTHLTFQDIAMSTTMSSSLNIILPELTSLVLCAEYTIDPIFEEITLPKLKELVLNIKTWPHRSITDLLRRSHCPLESLNLYFPPITELELIETLEIVQNTLQEFTVQSTGGLYSVCDNILGRLTDKGIGEVLCPKITVIALYECISCSPGRFTEMLESRLVPPLRIEGGGLDSSMRPSVVTLKVVEMYDNEVELLQMKPLRSLGLVLKIYSIADGSAIDMEPEEIERLKILKEEGLILRVYSPTTGHFGAAD